MQDYIQGHQRKYQNEDVNSPQFLAHKKHFMILSSAGKPVYSRYGSETKLSSLLALVQAFLSVFIERGDPLQSISVGEHRFCFKIQGPLYYVAISKTNESVEILQRQLEMLHNTIVFTLTNSHLISIFERHLNYDLRYLLGGTDVLLDSMAKSFRDPWIFLNSSPTIKLPSKFRLDLDKVWMASEQPKSCIFGMFIARKKLASIFHGKSSVLHPSDIQLLINLVYSSSTFKAVESWIPVCLPYFNSSSFLHAYICFVSKELCMILLSVSKETFFECSEFKSRFLNKMGVSSTSLELIDEAILADPSSVVSLGISGLRYCLINFYQMNQHFEMSPVAPYTNSQELKRLLILMQELQARVDGNHLSGRLAFQATNSETIVYQKTENYEVFLTFGPFVTKETVNNALVNLAQRGGPF